MKKFISGLMLVFAALTLTSCIEMSSETTLSFEKLPEAVIEGKAEGQLDKNNILVNINGKKVTLAAAESMGAVVEGAEYEGAGYHTLLVTYKDVTIAFTYLVNGNLPSAVDTSWANAEPYVITNAAQLRGLAHLVNSGDNLFIGKTVKLGADIDLAGYAWTPIGEGSRKGDDLAGLNKTFQGKFDGQGYTISNMNDAGYVALRGEPYKNSISNHLVYGYVYGLFGRINAEGVEIKNVKLENVQINGVSVVENTVYVADSVAGILGWSGAGSFTIENCEVSGSIKGFDAVGGIAGRLYTAGNRTFINCVNNAEVVASATAGSKCAGIIGYFTKNTALTLKGCKNFGEIGRKTENESCYIDELFNCGCECTIILDTETLSPKDTCKNGGKVIGSENYKEHIHK